jgi:predicted house-cleaning NTP pyrophosphatase (Maf/HAM1 superfamily)
MSSPETSESSPARRKLLEGLIEALDGKQSEIALNFHKTSIAIPRLRTAVELNGTISLTVHMRDLTENEIQAYSERAATSV